jgi:hypothetical protein
MRLITDDEVGDRVYRAGRLDPHFAPFGSQGRPNQRCPAYRMFNNTSMRDEKGYGEVDTDD